jgi:hypothetical protein
LGIALFLVAARTAQVLFVTSHHGYGINSRPEGFAVAMTLASPKLPSHSHRGCPLEEADDFGHRIYSRSA